MALASSAATEKNYQEVSPTDGQGKRRHAESICDISMMTVELAYRRVESGNIPFEKMRPTKGYLSC